MWMVMTGHARLPTSLGRVPAHTIHIANARANAPIGDLWILDEGDCRSHHRLRLRSASTGRDNHKQIALTADRKPYEISDIADRLRTRLTWGLLADIELRATEVAREGAGRLAVERLATPAIATRGWPRHGGSRRAARTAVVGRDRAPDELFDLALHIARAETHQSQRRRVPEHDGEEPASSGETSRPDCDRHREHLMLSDMLNQLLRRPR